MALGGVGVEMPVAGLSPIPLHPLACGAACCSPYGLLGPGWLSAAALPPRPTLRSAPSAAGSPGWLSGVTYWFSGGNSEA